MVARSLAAEPLAAASLAAEPLAAAESPDDEAAWAAALDAMELHLDEIRAGLEVGILPSPYAVTAPTMPMPTALGRRAIRLVTAQHDLEEALRERMGALSSVLAGAFPGGLAPGPVYLDRRG